MIQVFNFRIDPFSFWAGFVTGLVFLGLVLQIRKQLPGWIKSAGAQLHALQQSLSAGTESRLSNDLLNWIQKQHLASALFPLQAVMITPQIMAPPLHLETKNEFAQEEVTTLTIPYMPEWPETAAAFRAPTITLDDALQGGANLLLAGHPGSGKTVALADLASRMARNKVHGKLLENRFPIYFHVADILAKLNEKELLAPISHAVTSTYASAVVASRVPTILRSLFINGRALLLLDGLDEIQPEEVNRVKSYLKILINTYQGVQIVASVSIDNFGGLNQLGFIPVVLAGWGDKERKLFIDNWINQWHQLGNKTAPTDSVNIDIRLLRNWLQNSDLAATPFELTLKTWSALAGDIPSPDLPKLLETHLRRITANLSNAQAVSAQLAMAMVLSQKLITSQKEAENILNQAMRELSAQPSKDSTIPKEQTSALRLPGASPDLDNLINSGLLSVHAGSQVRFSHILFAGFLSGYALAAAQEMEALLDQPNWPGKHISIGFLGSMSDISWAVGKMLEQDLKIPTNPGLFHAARWLRLTSKTQNWRADVLRGLANLILKEYTTSGLSTRAVTALAVSGDPTVLTLFRQFLKSNNTLIRQLAVIGIGLYGDSKTVAELTRFTHDISTGVSRAACLALARIGNKIAIDAIIEVLLQGSEEMRRAAAEVLITNTDEGLEILKEALTMDDLLVRRAAVFGLMKLDHPEIVPLLEKIAVSDGQWVVRNVANQAIEQKKISSPYIPKPQPPLVDLPWLLEYASKIGIGISNENQAYELIINSLERGDKKERLSALEILAQYGDSTAIPNIYQVYFGSDESLREAAFDSIWQISASGVEIPSPIQFGLG